MVTKIKRVVPHSLCGRNLETGLTDTMNKNADELSFFSQS
jgi:hypothetical protein